MRFRTTWLLAILLGILVLPAVPVCAQEGDNPEERERRREEEMRRREDMERRERDDMERRRMDGGMEGPPGQPPHPGPMGGPPMKRPRQLSADDQAKVVAWLKEWDANRLAKMERTRAENPEMYNNLIAESWMEMMKLQDLKASDPERYDNLMQERKLDAQTRQLAEKYRQATDESARAAIRTELQTLVSQLFDIREAGREAEVKELEKRLAELKSIVDKRRSNKLLIVESRLKVLLGEKEFMDW